MSPDKLGLDRYAFFHQTLEKDSNLVVLKLELKTSYLCVSERGYSTGCYYHWNGRNLTIDNCCALPSNTALFNIRLKATIAFSVLLL